MPDTFRIRRATAQDAGIVAWHRARMFQDMGDVSRDAFEILRAKAQARLKEWLASDDYVGWLATPADQPEMVVGGAAGLLMKEIITWSKDEHLDRLLLHASDEGRSVYERLGFIAGNEMRFVGDS